MSSTKTTRVEPDGTVVTTTTYEYEVAPTRRFTSNVRDFATSLLTGLLIHVIKSYQHGNMHPRYCGHQSKKVFYFLSQ